MGSMGLLLADWSVELFRARRKKAKKAKMMEKMEKVEEMTYVGETIGEVGNTEKIVASREAETSTGEICSKLEKCSKVDPKSGGRASPTLLGLLFSLSPRPGEVSRFRSHSVSRTGP